MLPDAVRSTSVVAAAFLPPRNVVRVKLVDFDLGGVAIQDPTQGLQVKVWRAEVIGDDVVLSAEGVTPTTIFTQAGITEIALTFDQNMQPFIAYVLNDTDAHFRWFDGTLSQFVVSDLPAGSHSPRCALDDKRDAAGTLAGASDIILTYLREGTLYARVQRDRYSDEYELATGYEDYVLGQFGMNRVLRMQWQLYKPVISS